MKTFLPGIFFVLFLLALPFSAGAGEAMSTREYAAESAMGPEESGYQGFAVVEEGLSIGAGAYVGQSPYKNSGVNWLPLPLIGFENRYFYIRGMSGGIKLVNQRDIEVSVFVAYDGTSFDTSDTRNFQLKRLKNRQSSMMSGVQGRVHTPVGLFQASASADVLGHSNGFVGDAAYGIMSEHGPLELVALAGVTWKSHKYNNYYYGVSEGEARNSGLDAYRAGSGVAPYIELTASLSLTDRFEVFCTGEIEFLDSEVRHSPMVGKSSLLGVTGGLQYNF